MDATEAANAKVGKPPLSAEQRLLLRSGLPGTDAREAPEIVGSDWEANGFESFEALHDRVLSTGDVVVAVLGYRGFDNPNEVGSHAVTVYRDGDTVMVIDNGQETEFSAWKSRQSGVDSLAGMALKSDGTAGRSLGPDGKSQAVAGLDFKNVRIGARMGGRDEGLLGYIEPRAALPTLEPEFTTEGHRRVAEQAWQRLRRRVDAAFDAAEPNGPLAEHNPAVIRQMRQRVIEGLAGIEPEAIPAARRRLRLELIEQQWDADEFAAHRVSILQNLAAELATEDLPDSLRDQVNRMRLARELADLRAIEPTELTAENAQRLAELEGWVDRLTVAQRWATQLPGHPPVRLLGFPLPGETGNTMLEIGDVRTAEEVNVLVAAGPVPRAQQAIETGDPDLVQAMNMVSWLADNESVAVVLVQEGADLEDDVAALLSTRDDSVIPPAVVGFFDSRDEVRGEWHGLAVSPMPRDPHGVVFTALEWAGMRSVRDMLSAADADPDEVRSRARANDVAWRAWPPYVHTVLLELYPEVLAEAPGLPAAVRAEAGAAALRAGAHSDRTDDAQQSIAGSQEILDLLEATAERGLPVRRLSHAVDGDTRLLTVAYGNPDRASRVHWGCSRRRSLATP